MYASLAQATSWSYSRQQVSVGGAPGGGLIPVQPLGPVPPVPPPPLPPAPPPPPQTLAGIMMIDTGATVTPAEAIVTGALRPEYPIVQPVAPDAVALTVTSPVTASGT